MNEPIYTLQLPRPVAMLCITLMRKFPVEQVEQPLAIMMEQVEKAEMAVRQQERNAIADAVLAERTKKEETKVAK